MKPIGIYTVTNSLAVLVYEAESDYVVAGWSGEQEQTQKCPLLWDSEGEAYFVLGIFPVYLNEVMRTGL